MNKRQFVPAFAASGPALNGELWILAKVSAPQVGTEQYTGDGGYAGQDEIACECTCTCGATAHCIPSEEDASSAVDIRMSRRLPSVSQSDQAIRPTALVSMVSIGWFG
jgi:hypothetical protein